MIFGHQKLFRAHIDFFLAPLSIELFPKRNVYESEGLSLKKLKGK
jgi:hypothetical protein